MIQGLVCGELAQPLSRAAFERGLIIETAGPRDEVLKVLPPLTIGEGELREGLDLLEDALQALGRG
jgi:diaminobutyrate-2-oxoglutarate transaminase